LGLGVRVSATAAGC